ncbi:MAG: CBS domain-containing protein [Pseudomonadota bacterium]
MIIGEICNPVVVVVHKNMSIADAARLMREQHVGSLVVVEETDEGQRVEGILTDRDIVLSVVACDLDPNVVTVGDVILDTPVTIRADESVADALHCMRRHGVRRLPVVTERGILIGIVTVDDVLGIICEELNDVVSTITREQQRERVTRK